MLTTMFTQSVGTTDGASPVAVITLSLAASRLATVALSQWQQDFAVSGAYSS